MDYARRHGALIIYDAAYEAFIKDTDSEVPHSIFEIPGAEEVAVECRSFSKTAGFTGLRCAFTTIPAAVTIPGPDGSRVRLQDMWKRRQSTKYNGCPYIVQRAAEAVYSPEGQEQVHATIAAYSSCVPTLVVGYSVKARGIAKDLFGSWENYVLPVQTLEKKEDLTEAFLWLQKQEEAIRSRLTAEMPGYRERAREAGKLIRRLAE